MVRLDRGRRLDRDLGQALGRVAATAHHRARTARAVEAEHSIDIDFAEPERRLDVQHHPRPALDIDHRDPLPER
ncbi:hypothetical protein [Nannocystis exedens]|uniref:hypothetical protein n=1 Tax=Nannocystis exedens TaxID=54 RepID=UPI0011609CF2